MDNSNSIAIKTKNITISHGFFGREGGKSEGLYASLNCSDYVGDSEEAVKANLEIAKDFLTSESTAKLITLKQIHSNICIEIAKDNAISGIEADAMVTKEKNIAIGLNQLRELWASPELPFDATIKAVEDYQEEIFNSKNQAKKSIIQLKKMQADAIEDIAEQKRKQKDDRLRGADGLPR